MMLVDLPAAVTGNIKIGSVIYLVRKVSGHVLETELTALGKQGRPLAEVEWLNQRSYRYKLDLEANVIHALDASIKHRADMRRLWEIWEPHRKLLRVYYSESLRKPKR